MITIIKPLKTLKQTGWACPSTWKGITIDGEIVNIKYRWGILSVKINGVNVYYETVGDPLEGYMDTCTMMSVIGLLLKREEEDV